MATDVNVLLIDPMSKACIGRVRNIARAISKAHRLFKHGMGYVSDEHHSRNDALLEAIKLPFLPCCRRLWISGAGCG